MPDSLLSLLCLCFTHSTAKACVAPQTGDQRKLVSKEDPNSALTFRGDPKTRDQPAVLTEPRGRQTINACTISLPPERTVVKMSLDIRT